MAEIIRFVAVLIDSDFAYVVEGDVFFDVARDGAYGKLTNRTVDMLQGEGGEAWPPGSDPRPISRCGNGPSRVNRPGTARGAKGGRAGTSSVPR